MYGVQLKGKKRSNCLMLLFGLNETIDQLAMACSVRWHDNMLGRENDHILSRALDFKVENQR